MAVPGSCRTELAEVSGTGIDVEPTAVPTPVQTSIPVPNLPKCPVPVLMTYRTYRSVRYRYSCYTELTEVSCTGMKVCTGTGGTGIHIVPNLPKRPVPVLMSYRSYQVSGTGIDGIPNFPKCPVPVIPAVCLGTYRTKHTLEKTVLKRTASSSVERVVEVTAKRRLFLVTSVTPISRRYMEKNSNELLFAL